MLAILLVATSLAATVTGLVLKAQLQKYVGGWEDRLAIAVPFMLLHDNTDLRRMEQARQAGSTPNQPEQPENPTAPEAPDESKIPTDTETPAQPARTRAFSTMPCSSEIPAWSAPPTMQGLARRITSQTLA